MRLPSTGRALPKLKASQRSCEQRSLAALVDGMADDRVSDCDIQWVANSDVLARNDTALASGPVGRLVGLLALITATRNPARTPNAHCAHQSADCPATIGTMVAV